MVKLIALTFHIFMVCNKEKNNTVKFSSVNRYFSAVPGCLGVSRGVPVFLVLVHAVTGTVAQLHSPPRWLHVKFKITMTSSILKLCLKDLYEHYS